MQRVTFRWFVGGAALAGALITTHVAGWGHAARADGEPRVPVLVELFTSQGCSSCPPAEEELSRLDREQPIPGVRVVPLAFHVDYWNGLGWVDPFSSAAATSRQREYAHTRGGRVYTPEAIVQGGHDCVGSDDHALQALVNAAAAAPLARVDVTRSTQGAPAGILRASVRVSRIAAGLVSGALHVALVQRNIATEVPRGENAGKRIQHAPLVRDLRTLGVVGADGGPFEVDLAIPPNARAQDLSVVAFLQDVAGGRVVGVGTMP